MKLRGQDGERAKRARQRELEFYEHAIKASDPVAKRKAVAKDEEDPMKRARFDEGVPTDASSGQSTSSRSSGGGTVDARGEVTGIQRGEKRAAEDPPADCDHEMIPWTTREREDFSMDCASFQEYCDAGGLWTVACRELEEDVEDDSSGVRGQDSCEAQHWDDRTGKPLDAEKVRAVRAEELRELDRRVWEEADWQD